ncbi:MAG: sulfatase [Gemmataceae bacterium]
MLTLLLLWAAPNLVLIQADDLGINDLGCYGRTDHRTPNLDALARQGLRFTSAYSAQSVCSPSRAALLTGKHPARLHLTTFLPGRADAPSQKLLHPKIRQQLPLEEFTLAEYLQKAGYATACIGKWHLGGKGFSPTQQGFEVSFPGKANTTPSDSEGGKGEYMLTRHAIKFIDDSAGKPFFLYLSHHNPHIPLAARADLIKKHADAFNPLYAAVIETLDDSIGLLLEHLDKKRLANNTIVVFVSDNGGLHVPELRDDAPTHNTPFRAGKGFLYEGGIRVPLILRWPGKIKPGVNHAAVVATDLMPTLLALCGLKVPTGLDGVDWSSTLKEGGPKPGRELFWYCPHYTNQGGRPALALRQGDWKLLQHLDGGVELYNLASDPGEQVDLARKEPKRLTDMLKRAYQHRIDMNVQTMGDNPKWNQNLWRELYVDTDVSRLRPARSAAEMTPKLAAWRKKMDAVTRPAP